VIGTDRSLRPFRLREPAGTPLVEEGGTVGERDHVVAAIAVDVTDRCGAQSSRAALEGHLANGSRAGLPGHLHEARPGGAAEGVLFRHQVVDAIAVEIAGDQSPRRLPGRIDPRPRAKPAAAVTGAHVDPTIGTAAGERGFPGGE